MDKYIFYFGNEVEIAVKVINFLQKVGFREYAYTRALGIVEDCLVIEDGDLYYSTLTYSSINNVPFTSSSIYQHFSIHSNMSLKQAVAPMAPIIRKRLLETMYKHPKLVG